MVRRTASAAKSAAGKLPAIGCAASARRESKVDTLRIETGWPVPRLWPNDRSHRMAKWRAGDTAKREAYWSTCNAKPRGMKPPKGERFKLTIEAHPAVDRERDDDNLVAACKPHRDGIASALGVNDTLFDLQPVQWGDKHPTGRLYFIVEPARKSGHG
jgi:crossover junction endodeoxyribonuclease RusA